MRSTGRKFPGGILSIWPWHPILFAIFPVLSLLANNVSEIKGVEALRSLLISPAAAGLLSLVLALLLKDAHKSAAIITAGLIFFFSYGHIYNFLQTAQAIGISLGRHRILAPIFLLAFAAAVWAVARPRRNFRLLTSTLNIIAVCAVVLPLLQISTFYVQEKAAAAGSNPHPASLSVTLDQPRPDIYYIILDGYSRDDVLKNTFDYDNRAFLNELQEMGFTIPRCSLSNYAQTQLSLASALNLNYIDALGEGFNESRTDRVGMPGLVKKSAVRELLEGLGYTTAAFETGYYWTQVEDAGIYLSPKSSAASLLDITGGLNGFEALLVKNSASLIFVDGASILPGFLQPDLDHPHQVHRQQVLFTLDQLERLPARPGPLFVFAHIVSPHKPFVFGPDGGAVADAVDEKTAYRDQVDYLNSRIIPLLHKIISNSATPPIIIVQGDHGGVETAGVDRMAILNAYYLPNGGEQLLYENISPVNSFRLILSYYFGASYELLEDVSYLSDYQNPYQYTVVQDSRSGCP